MPTTSSTLDAAISDLQAAADSCTYGLTNRRLKPLRTTMEQQPLCLDAYPAIMAMPVAKLGNDSKQKYMRVVLQLCESAADAAFDAILCAQVVRTASRPGSLDSTAKIASSVIRILANAQRGDDCDLEKNFLGVYRVHSMLLRYVCAAMITTEQSCDLHAAKP